MKFKADEIASVIQKEIEDFRGQIADQRSRSRPRSRRRHCAGLRPGRRDGRRNGRVSQRRARAGLQPRRKLRRRDHPRRLPRRSPKATRSKTPGELLSVPVGDALIGRVVDPLGNPLDGKGPILSTETPPAGNDRAGHRRPAAGQAAAADRHQGHRRHDPDRPRPARADHRRPQDRQDRHRHRHDHQPEGAGRHLRLRRLRSAGSRRSPASSKRCEPRRDGLHDRRQRRPRAIRPRCSTSLPYAGAAMAEYFM